MRVGARLKAQDGSTPRVLGLERREEPVYNIEVDGDHAHPLYTYRESQKSGLLGASIKWNCTKFLIYRRGQVAARHAPTTAPQSLTREIEALL